MSTKELLYIQDALGHEDTFKQSCCEAANQLSDNELSNMCKQLEKQHMELFAQFYKLI